MLHSVSKSAAVSVLDVNFIQQRKCLYSVYTAVDTDETDFTSSDPNCLSRNANITQQYIHLYPRLIIHDVMCKINGGLTTNNLEMYSWT